MGIIGILAYPKREVKATQPDLQGYSKYQNMKQTKKNITRRNGVQRSKAKNLNLYNF